MVLETFRSGDTVSARKELQLIINTQQILDGKAPAFCLFRLWFGNRETKSKQFLLTLYTTVWYERFSAHGKVYKSGIRIYHGCFCFHGK